MTYEDKVRQLAAAILSDWPFSSVRELASELGLTVPEEELIAVVDRVLAANSSRVEQYRGGRTQLLGFFVGQALKALHGSDPRRVKELLEHRLTEH